MSTPDNIPAAPGRRLPRRVIAGAAALLLTGGAALWYSSGNQSSSASSAETGLTAAETAALATVRSFLTAGTVEARAACLLNGSRILPQVESYYAGRDSENIDPASFQPLPWRFDSPAGDTVVLRSERDRGLPAIIAVVKCEDGKWLMDWDLWVQSEDGLFAEFQNRPAEGEETTLRLRLSAEPGEKSCRLTMADPFENQSMTLPVDRPDLRTLYNGALTGGPRHATVQLVWLNDALTGTLKPAVRRHVCWGFDGIDGVITPLPAATSPLPALQPPAITPAPVILAGKQTQDAVHAAVQISSATPARSTPATRTTAPVPAPGTAAALTPPAAIQNGRAAEPRRAIR